MRREQFPPNKSSQMALANHHENDTIKNKFDHRMMS